jgi:hypothetical protein
MSLKPALTDTDRLRHMRDASCAAQRFVQGRSRADLDTDEMLSFSLVRALEIIFGSNSQVSTRKRDVKVGKPEDTSRQPEQIRASRDTWSYGISLLTLRSLYLGFSKREA